MNTETISTIDELNHYVDSFVLPKEIIPELSEYYLLHWSASYFFSRAKGSILFQDGIYYFINYGTLRAGYKGQIALSFRRFKNDYYGIVIVKELS